MTRWSGIAVLGLVLMVLPGAAAGETAETGDRVQLKATHPDGVPVHPVPEGINRFFRVPDGAVASVLEVNPPNGWLRLEVEGGQTGWITPRYLDRVLEGGGDGPDGSDPGMALEKVWGSPEGCREVLDAGGRLGWDGSEEESLRLAAWNIRWFPRGCPSASGCQENATDVDWLGCTIAWMDLDLLALQEILDAPDARLQMGRLRQELDELTNGSWQVDLQGCGNASSQRVGFLWDASRVQLETLTDSCQLNGAAPGPGCSNPCAGNLRPGRYARVESAREGGADFHVASVHLDSGRSDRDFDHRQIAIERIAFLEIDGQEVVEIDQDIVVLGDFNTMGRSEPPEVSGEQEIDLFDEALAPGYRRVVPDVECSEYFRGHGGLLDHVVVSTGMAEAAVGSRVSGYCAVRECEELTGGEPAAYHVLSDHCPVLFEVRDEDLDGG